MLTREQILASNSATEKRVFVEEWGGEVRLMSPSALEIVMWRDKHYSEANGAARTASDEVKAGLELVTLCLVDENGDRMFTVNGTEEISQVIRRSETLQVLADACGELTNLTTRTEDLAKNSTSGQTDGLNSSLPSS